MAPPTHPVAPIDGEGFTHAGTRFLIADRDLDRLGHALAVWEQRESLLAYCRTRAEEVDHVAA